MQQLLSSQTPETLTYLVQATTDNPLGAGRPGGFDCSTLVKGNSLTYGVSPFLQATDDDIVLTFASTPATNGTVTLVVYSQGIS
jgi:hypothetical protein